ncbi:MAG: bacteriochlorophyll 4-vinyl reductase [Pseudomonadota bacterium]
MSGMVGPNASLQLATALRAEGGDVLAAEVFGAAGQAALLEAPPRVMIDERVPAALFDALWRVVPDRAERIAAEAGRRTADYVLANRMPAAIRRLLRALPDRLAARLLLVAIRRNAWTFAGSGACVVAVPGAALAIDGNPMPMPGATWHRAVLGRMAAALLHPATRVAHVACPHGAGRACFAIRAPGGDGAAPCGDCRLRG